MAIIGFWLCMLLFHRTVSVRTKYINSHAFWCKYTQTSSDTSQGMARAIFNRIVSSHRLTTKNQRHSPSDYETQHWTEKHRTFFITIRSRYIFQHFRSIFSISFSTLQRSAATNTDCNLNFYFTLFSLGFFMLEKSTTVTANKQNF